jgi:hypothetical protein
MEKERTLYWEKRFLMCRISTAKEGFTAILSTFLGNYSI